MKFILYVIGLMLLTEVVVSATTVGYKVGTSTDDGYEDATEWVNVDENYIWLDEVGYHGGFRWDNVNVPQGATIDSAEIYVYSDSANDAVLTIYFEDTDDAATITGGDGTDISGRTKTSNSTAWSEESLSGWVNSPDIKLIVQEIVDRAGWSATNAMFVILFTGANTLVPTSYDGNAALAATLNITYTEVAVDTCTPPASGDYTVDCSDNCNWDSADTIPADITMTGTGINVLSAVWTFTGSNQYINIGSGCEFALASGAEFK